MRSLSPRSAVLPLASRKIRNRVTGVVAAWLTVLVEQEQTVTYNPRLGSYHLSTSPLRSVHPRTMSLLVRAGWVRNSQQEPNIYRATHRAADELKHRHRAVRPRIQLPLD